VRQPSQPSEFQRSASVTGCLLGLYRVETDRSQCLKVAYSAVYTIKQ